MESFISLFIINDSYVVSSLVLGITIIGVLLLLFNHKSPETVVKSEMGGADNIEGALRRVLGEQRWSQGSASADSGKMAELEEEVLTKDRAIADLNKQLTHASGGGSSESNGDNSELLKKISELESRLQEYEIIEDDIADLSLYRSENDKLKAELKILKDQLGGGVEVVAEEEPAAQTLVKDEEVKEAPVTSIQDSPRKEKKVVDGTDLVAEFEKVVNNQDQLTESQDQVVEEGVTEGKVVMTDKEKEKGGNVEIKVHPKLKNVNPDSKEEAEVFISDLKALKKVKK